MHMLSWRLWSSYSRSVLSRASGTVSMCATCVVGVQGWGLMQWGQADIAYHYMSCCSRPTLVCAGCAAGVFDWIVTRCNAKLDMGKKGSGNFIAILDIYGFEQFQVNR